LQVPVGHVIALHVTCGASMGLASTRASGRPSGASGSASITGGPSFVTASVPPIGGRASYGQPHSTNPATTVTAALTTPG
jgi:hypothetical protein